MPIRVLTPEEVCRAMELAESSYRPPQILEQQQRIEEEIGILEFRTETGQQVTEEDIQRVVAMKLELDGLYGLWVEGKIE